MTINRGYLTKSNLANQHLTPQKDKYARPDNRVEYQLFGSEYFSNADVKLYFGDIWVDDITSIAFSLQEELLPIYGYHSYTYDTVARGKRLVQGNFSMNFTTVSYLHQIIANANPILYALEQGERKQQIKPEYYQQLTLAEILKKLGKESFEQIADEYEKAIWGENNDENQRLSYADRPHFQQDALGFDIRIQYGAISESVGIAQDRFYVSQQAERPVATVDVLNGVQITGMSKQISTRDQGAPIQEMYSFIARDLNGVALTHLQRQAGATAGTKVNTQTNSSYRDIYPISWS